MLSARDLTLRRGPEPLFEQVNFIIFRGDRVGLTGANGVGKSSLFAGIRGELAPDRGEIEVPANLSMAVVEQEITAVERPALEFVLDGDVELRRLMARIAVAEADDSRAMELAELYAELLGIDGYRAPARAAAIMHGLGFHTTDHQRTVGEFSGGWRVRLAMAKALNSRADLLLLDEPTNHLDLDAIVWLEDWLRNYPGTLLMISHDREFLDTVISRVLHIENRTIRAYSGNYSQFEIKRAEEMAQQKSLLARQQRQIAHITSYINRFRASATKARQAQSRIKMLERMERIVPAHVDSPFEFEFRKPAKTPRPLLTLDEAACGHGDRIVVGDMNLSIGPQDRIALLGINGAGKSTLTRFLAGESAPLAGQRIASPDLAVGYFAQQQLEQLNPGETAFWHVRNLGGPDYARCEEQAVRDHLGRFGFSGDRVFEPIGVFSGGEKARLTLALIVARRPNLLLLDEPTNHLDLEMRHALTVALQGFEGGMVVVSHDRHLVRMVADSLYLVADGAVQPFEGDLEDYQRWLKDRNREPEPAKRTSPPPRPPPPIASGSIPGRPRRKADLQRELTRLEEKLAQLQAELARIDAVLAEPGMHERTRASDTRLLGLERADVTKVMEEVESRWIEVGTELDSTPN